MAFNVSGLTAYVKENTELLTKEAIFGSRKGDTIAKAGKELGVKTKARMHQLEVNAPLQSGKGCGFSASGDDVLSEREIEVAIMKVNKSWCPDDLIGKVYEYEVRLAAGQESLPFEAKLMDEVNLSINKQLEKLVWQGDKTGNSDLIDGLLTIAAGADSASTITGETATGTSVYNAIEEAILAIPENLLDSAVCFVSPNVYRAFVNALVHKNLFHYPAGANQEDIDIYFPGTSVPVHKTIGMEGVNDKIYITSWNNIRFGTDMLNDKEEFKVWFSEDDDNFKLKVKFAAGINTVYPDMVMVYTIK